MHLLKSTPAEVYELKPEDFDPKVQVSACYLEIDNHLLLLERSPSSTEGGYWGVPAGKLEANEFPEDAAKRELLEESGIEITNSQLHSMGCLHIRKPDIDFTIHLFKVTLDAMPEIQLSNEHSKYLWANSNDLESLPLMNGARETLQKYRSTLAQKRNTASVNAYLILRDKDQVLLLLRQNTGYLDNHWSFPAGHIELGECATEGMIREAHEEVGIVLLRDNLKVSHIMHRKSNRFNIDIFFECSKWKGEIKNQEPKKCGGVEFFSFASLPSKFVDYNAFALKAIKNKQSYSEWGFS